MQQNESGKRENPKQEAFLAAYASCGIISQAAAAAGINRVSHLRWKRDDPQYARRFKRAGRQAREALEQEARRRAVEGWIETKTVTEIKGEERRVTETTVKRRVSDSLLMFMLKGAWPDKYGDKIRHSGGISADGGTGGMTQDEVLAEEHQRLGRLLRKRMGTPNAN
jgi:hypothetical protein